MLCDQTNGVGNGCDGIGALQLANADQLREELDPLVPTFLLIDPLVGEPFPEIGQVRSKNELQTIREKVWGRSVTCVELPQTIRLPSYQQPYLVHFENKDDWLIGFSLEIAHTERLAAQAEGISGDGKSAHRISGWLQSNLSPSSIAEIVAMMCKVNTTCYTQATYLRIIDRRVLGLLVHVVGTERVIGQFGQLRSWIFLNALGTLTHLRHLAAEVNPLRQNYSEWKRMENGQLVNRAVAQWLGTLAESSASPNHSIMSIYCSVEDAIATLPKAIQKWPKRFATINDETAWAALMLLHPAAFQDELIKNMLDHTGSADMPPESFQYIVRELRNEFLKNPSTLKIEY